MAERRIEIPTWPKSASLTAASKTAVQLYDSRAGRTDDACGMRWQQKSRLKIKGKGLMDKFHFWFGHEEAFGSNRTHRERGGRCQQTNLQNFHRDAGIKTAEEMRSCARTHALTHGQFAVMLHLRSHRPPSLTRLVFPSRSSWSH